MRLDVGRREWNQFVGLRCAGVAAGSQISSSSPLRWFIGLVWRENWFLEAYFLQLGRYFGADLICNVILQVM